MKEVTVNLHIGSDTVNIEIKGDAEAAAFVSKALVDWNPTILTPPPSVNTEEKAPSTSEPDSEETTHTEEIEAEVKDESYVHEPQDRISLDVLGSRILDTIEPGTWYFAREIAEHVDHNAERVAAALRYRVSDEFEVDRSRKSNRYRRKKKGDREMDPDELEELNQSLKRQHKQNQEIQRDTVGPSGSNTGY